MAESMKSSPPKSEEEVAPLNALISSAYKAIDMAVQKGVFHQNNGARKKARCAKFKREMLISAGLYKPAADSPGYNYMLRVLQKEEKVEQKAAVAAKM